jgi:hypothetical protein
MTEWGWVAFAYVVGYVSFLLYAGSIAWRSHKLRRAIERAE